MAADLTSPAECNPHDPVFVIEQIDREVAIAITALSVKIVRREAPGRLISSLIDVVCVQAYVAGAVTIVSLREPRTLLSCSVGPLEHLHP